MTVGNIITSTNPGDLAGGADMPSNVNNIMSNMFTQMVSPENIPVNGNPQKPAPAQTSQNLQPVIQLNEPAKQEVKIDEPDVSFFEQEAPQQENTQQIEVQDDEPDMSDIPDEPAKENWKKAREALKNERTEKKRIAKEFETAKKELERYQKGEVVPEIITAKDLRIQELEKYEVAVNGKLSEEYQTLVVKPASEKKTALNKLADDYQVPEHIRESLLQRIVETENEKERNQLITKYFPDAIGATKVEGLVKELHDLGNTALEMEKKPAEVMQTLQSRYQEKKAKEAEAIASQFEAVSKGAWNKALEKTSQEGLFPELILDVTNAEHSKIAEKNQHRASIQYGAVVKKLHQNGLKTLPEDVAIGLARSIQLAVGGVGLAKQLQAAQQRIAELESNNGMIAKYLRPGVNSNGVARTAPVTDSAGPMSPKDAGAAALAVFNRK